MKPRKAETLKGAVTHCCAMYRAERGSNAAPFFDPTPSAADIAATRELYRAGQLLKIGLLDHVIVGAGNSFISLRARGDLKS